MLLPPWAKVMVPLDVSYICNNSFLEDGLFVHRDSSIAFLMTVNLALQLCWYKPVLFSDTQGISSYLNIK
jgi:hypothetical protein